MEYREFMEFKEFSEFKEFGEFKDSPIIPGKILTGSKIATREYLENNSLLFHLFPKKMESKKAREPIFGIVACFRGGARCAHLKAIKWSAPLSPSICATIYFRKSLVVDLCGAEHRIRIERVSRMQNAEFKIQNDRER